MDKINIAIIGYGTIGKVHRKVIDEEGKSFELVAISDVQDPENTIKIKFYKNYMQMLSKEDVDAISIATPPSSHFQIAKDCLNTGKHVLIEKPPTIDAERCKKLKRLARAKKVTLFTAFHMRYNPAVIKATNTLKTEDINKIEIIFKEHVFNFHDPDRWVFNPKISGGGVLMDSGTNALSVIKAVLNDDFKFKIIKEKAAKENNLEVETKATVDFVVNDSIDVQLNMDWLYEPEDVRLMHFYTKNDRFTIDINRGSLIKNNQILFQISKGVDTMLEEYTGVYNHFFDLISQNKTFVSTEEIKLVRDVYKLKNK